MQIETETSALSDEDIVRHRSQRRLSLLETWVVDQKGTTDAFYRWLSSQWKKAVNLLTRPNQMMYYLDMTRRRWSTTKLNMQLMPNLHCTTSQYRLHNKTNNPLPPAPIVESVVGISHSTHPQWIVASYSHHTKGFYFQLVVVE